MTSERLTPTHKRRIGMKTIRSEMVQILRALPSLELSQMQWYSVCITLTILVIERYY